MSAAFSAMRPDQISDATPQINALQRSGGAIGTAVLAVVLQRAGVGAHTPEELAGAFDTAYWWAFGIAALSLIPCIMLLRAERPQAESERSQDEPEPMTASPEALADAVGV